MSAQLVRELTAEARTNPSQNYNALRKNKFNAKKTEVDGILFDSKLEAQRYQELLLLEKAGFIDKLQRQVVFALNVKGELICKKIVDFVYWEGDGLTRKHIAEEVKSRATKTRDYRIKMKLFNALYPGYEHREYEASRRQVASKA